MILKAPRGTQDLLPDRTPAWVFVENRIREVVTRYGFGEIRTPIFERTELFQRGVGESTDIVQKEMYTFDDRKGRSLTLRPEGTAPVARAFVEHKLNARGKPTKLFYLGPMFRYERPQAGRFRQHHQVGAELLGAEDPAADFEVIALLVDILTDLGLKEPQVLLNSVGDAACRPKFSETLRKYLQERLQELCPDCVRRTEQNPLRVLDCNVPGCREVAKDIPSIQDHLCDDCRKHQDAVTSLLAGGGIEFIQSDRLVRGLDYYTRTVFEIQHGGLGAQNAVGGGGRYDGLVGEVGGSQTPGVGFSSGIERILLALEAEGVDLPMTYAPEVTVIVVGGDTERAEAIHLTRRLRRRFRTEVDLLNRSMGGQMKGANKQGARLAVLVGSGELLERVWTVKEMETGEQEAVPDGDLEDRLGQLLRRTDERG